MRRTVRSKWRWVFLFWVIQAGLIYIGWPALFWDRWPSAEWRVYIEPGYAGGMMTIIACLSVLQAAFLQPVRRPRASSGSIGGRLLHASLAGVAVGILAVCAALALAGALQYFTGWGWIESALDCYFTLWPWLHWGIVGLVAAGAAGVLAVRGRRAPVTVSLAIAGMSAGLLIGGIAVAVVALAGVLGGSVDKVAVPLMLVGPLAGWALATPFLWAFSRHKPPETALGRISAWLFTGTVLEAMAVMPLDVMVRRKTDCYCSEGTLWTLTACWAVGTFALGPVIWLYPLRRRRQRWYKGMCPGCGYDMRGCASADRCPECGLGWRSPRAAG